MLIVGWVRRSRNPTKMRWLSKMLGYAALRLNQTTRKLMLFLWIRLLGRHPREGGDPAL